MGAYEPDIAPIRNPDYLAERLLGPEERALVSDQAVVRALEQDFGRTSPRIPKRWAP